LVPNGLSECIGVLQDVPFQDAQAFGEASQPIRPADQYSCLVALLYGLTYDLQTGSTGCPEHENLPTDHGLCVRLTDRA